MVTGKVPLPADLQRRIDVLRQAGACRARAMRIFGPAEALDDAASFDLAVTLMDRSKELRRAGDGAFAGRQLGRRGAVVGSTTP